MPLNIKKPPVQAGGLLCDQTDSGPAGVVLLLPAPSAVWCLVRVPTAAAPVVLLKLRLVFLADMLWRVYVGSATVMASPGLSEPSRALLPVRLVHSPYMLGWPGVDKRLGSLPVLPGVNRAPGADLYGFPVFCLCPWSRMFVGYRRITGPRQVVAMISWPRYHGGNQWSGWARRIKNFSFVCVFTMRFSLKIFHPR